MIAEFFNLRNLSLTDYALLLVAIGYVVLKVLEATGRTKSSQLLRRENEDLVRRNLELEAQVERHEIAIDRMKEEANERQKTVDRLEAKIAELERQSQAAVLDRLLEIDSRADVRHVESLGVLQTIASNTSPPVHITQEEK